MADLPDWLEAYAQDLRTLFGLADWEIVVKLVRVPGGDPTNEGHSRTDFRYLSATIELNRKLPKEGLRAVLMHEMLHVVLAPIEQAYARICELVPEPLRGHALNLHDDGLEQTIERLTRALQREIKPREQETTP